MLQGVVCSLILCAIVVIQVPSGVPNTFAPDEEYQHGLKFQWKDTDGNDWEVWLHSPSTNPAKSHYIGAQIWTVRIRRRVRGQWSWFLGNQRYPKFDDDLPPTGRGNLAPRNWGSTAAAHMPLAWQG